MKPGKRLVHETRRVIIVPKPGEIIVPKPRELIVLKPGEILVLKPEEISAQKQEKCSKKIFISSLIKIQT